ncbi:iron-containing alcohol dehydrogenase [Bordetella sp. 02P26C-1]|uniref:iron-containing alcohol dehydrogenase n=1 Tax=Bordetella sp. 02P26C-1 TaxID=2683195 RepID=UPI001F388864|nr:iron-containing alcohol dehydrogenase [Bordetella sp. 02P26C-1]
MMRLDYGVTRAPARLIFGPGQRRAIGTAAASLGKRALICTDARFGALPIMQEILKDLAEQGVQTQLYSETEAELPLESILACVDRYRDFAPDVLIGIGGGSCVDLAKLVSLLLVHSAPLSQYYGEFKVPGPILPVIAVPTTSGTGAEVTPVAVLGDPALTMKVGISSPELIPHTAICDPELTLTCPKGLTAISGADAMAHAIEAFAATTRQADPAMAMTRVFVGKNVLSDHYALTAIKLIYSNLRRATSEGGDLDARTAVMLGSTYAGLAFGSAGTSAAHAIQYPIGAMTSTAHGLGIGILLPYTMAFNLPVAAADYAEIGRAIGVASAGDADEDAAKAAIEAIRALFAEVSIPVSLRAIGIDDAHIEDISTLSMNAKRLVENNPRPLDPSAIKGILAAAMQAE